MQRSCCFVNSYMSFEDLLAIHQSLFCIHFLCFRGHTASRWKVLCCCWSDDDDFKIPDYNTESCVVWRAQRSEDLKSYTAWLKRSLVRTGRGILLPLDTFRLVFLTSSSCQQALLYSSFTAGALLRDQFFLSFLRWILTENRPPTYSSV